MIAARMPAGAVTAYDALAQGLARLADQGRRTPCQANPDPWSPDAPVLERRAAAVACAWCPLLNVCRAYADAAGEGWGVWAGEDRTPRQVPRETTTQSTTNPKETHHV